MRLVARTRAALAAGAEILPLDRLRASAVLADVRWPQGARAVLDRANALRIPTVLDAEMGDALTEALDRLAGDANVRVVVITGGAPGYFNRHFDVGVLIGLVAVMGRRQA